MPNLTTPLLLLTGDTQTDLKRIDDWATGLVDDLKALFCNLDGGNVLEASSVKAQNIDCTKARIKDAQIQDLTADKLTAGTIDALEINVININADNIVTGTLDADKVTIHGESAAGEMQQTGDCSAWIDKNGNTRILIGNVNGSYIFIVQSADGRNGIYMDEDGKIHNSGSIETDEDCLIQGELRVGLYGTGQKGIRIYGDAYFPDPETGAYAEEYASILPYVDSDGRKGINIEGNVWINGKEITNG